MARILLVDDEESIIDFISYNLEKHGHAVEVARDGMQAAGMASSGSYDLVILDIMLPDIDGFEVLKRLRTGSDVPVLMLSALDTVPDKVLGLELGADDYLAKPFSVRELQARVKALLRRAAPTSREQALHSGPLRLDVNRHRCEVDGHAVELTSKEFELLHYLMLNQGIALSRARVMEVVWGIDTPGSDRTIDSHVKTLRKKLRDAGLRDPIETLRGVGYRFTDEAHIQAPQSQQ
ncbi:MAG TPA: response regulator transcription factor [Candidatus Anoxymicrobiaceae bacterium]